MNTPQCICLTYIGDNGPCPIHGKPPADPHRINLAPRVLRVFSDDQLLAMTAERHNVKIERNPHKGGQP